MADQVGDGTNDLHVAVFVDSWFFAGPQKSTHPSAIVHAHDVEVIVVLR